jgi:hypothetical protein
MLCFKYKQDGVLNRNRMMDNVQKHNLSKNVLPSQTFRSCHTNLNIYFFIHTLFNANGKIEAVCRLLSSELWHHVVLYFFTDDRGNRLLLLVTMYKITGHKLRWLQPKFSLLQKLHVSSMQLYLWNEPKFVCNLHGFEPKEWWTKNRNVISNSITGCDLYIDLTITALKKC